MITGKTLSNYTKLFPPNKYQKNDKIRNKYFKDKYGKKSSYIYGFLAHFPGPASKFFLKNKFL